MVAVVQARMGSSRLPGKVLLDIAGRPALSHVLTRAARIHGLSRVILAIPDARADDVLEPVGRAAGADVVRGDADDVLDRVHTAAVQAGADAVVRITADCPVLDPMVSSRVLARFLAGDVDYASNTHPPTFPDGYDTEVVSASALRIAWEEAVDPYEREHVTPFVWRRPHRFRAANVADDIDRSAWRLTLDTPADLRRLQRLCAHFDSGSIFGLAEVVEAVRQDPDLLTARNDV